MRLRKCPSCSETVGAESDICSRCGVNFQGAMIRKIVWRTLSVLLLAWLIIHFAFHRF